tara:strand:+ start:163 stop:642 length:480 start_codon:yes stop_codon:yes gene_type:complete
MVVQYGIPALMAGVKMAKWMKPLVRKVISANKKGVDLQKYRTKLIETYGHAKNDVNKAFKLAKEVIASKAKPKIVKPKIPQIKKYADKLGTKEGTTFSKGPLYGSPLKNPRALNLAYRRMLSEKVKEGITKKKLSGNRIGGSVSKYSTGGGVRKSKYSL